LGEVVIEWNQTEGRARRMLSKLIQPPSDANYILLAHMGNTTLTDAIKAYSELQSAEMKDLLAHYCNYFDRLREYRNFYVHGIMRATQRIDHETRTGTPIGEISQVTARGRLSVSTAEATLDDLGRMLGWMLQLSPFDTSLFWDITQTRPQYALPRRAPSKPPLPDKLQKTHQFPIAEAQQQQAPQPE
jgi:hypothetical protein